MHRSVIAPQRTGWLRPAGWLAILALAAGCAAPAPSAYLQPANAAAAAPNAAAPAAGAARSPGNQALAVRATMLFRQMCLDADHDGARATVARLGFRRVPVGEVARGGTDAETWAYQGYDTYTLMLRAGPGRDCVLGVHLVEPAQAEAAFQRMLVGLARDGLAVTEPRRADTPIRPLGSRVTGPGGRLRVVMLSGSGIPENRIRTVLSASDVAPPAGGR